MLKVGCTHGCGDAVEWLENSNELLDDCPLLTVWE